VLKHVLRSTSSAYFGLFRYRVFWGWGFASTYFKCLPTRTEV